jgi:hypothetical protein
MKTRPWIRGLTLAGSILLLVLVCALFARSLARPPAPPPVEEPAHSEDESAVLLARTGNPPAAPERRSVPALGTAPARPAFPGPETPEAVTAHAPGVAGMVIGLDPETGTWGPPTREQLRELEEIRSRTLGDAHRVAKPGWLPEVRHPDGHVSVDLNGQFQEFTTVRLGPDGKPLFTCVHESEEAERVVAEPVPALEER